jgi:hypothetical protein
MASTSAGSSLAPEPTSPGLDGMQDAMAMLYELVATQGQEQVTQGETSVTDATREQQTEASEQESALKQQEADEAKMNCGSLFGSICHIFDAVGDDIARGRITDVGVDAVTDTMNTFVTPRLFEQLEQLAPQVAEYVGIAAAIVGAGALTASTGGTGGIAVAAVVIALSASGMLASHTHCFGKDSAEIGLSLEVASAVVSLGASSAMVTDTAVQTATAAMDVVSGGSDVVAGASAIAVGEQQAQVLDDTADVQATTVALSRTQRMLSDLVDGMKQAQKSNSNALQSVAAAAHTYGQTLALASAGKA